MTIRLEDQDREALQALAYDHAHGVSAEIRLAVRRHIGPAAEALKDARPAARPGDAMPTPAPEARVNGA